MKGGDNINKTRFTPLYAALVAIVSFVAITAWAIGENGYIADNEFADSTLYEIPVVASVDYYVPFPVAAPADYYDDEAVLPECAVGCCNFEDGDVWAVDTFRERVQKNRERVTFNWFPEALAFIIGGETIWSRGTIFSGEEALWSKEAMFIALVSRGFARHLEIKENGFEPIPEEDLVQLYIPIYITGLTMCCSAPKVPTGEHEVRLPCEDGCIRIERTYMCTSCGMFAVIKPVYITGEVNNRDVS